MCAAGGAGKYNDFFDFDWQSQGWNLMVALGLNYEVGAVPLVLDEVYNWEDLFTLHGFISNSHFGFHFLLLCLAFTFFRKKKSRWLQSFNPKNQGSDVIGFKVRIADWNMIFW